MSDQPTAERYVAGTLSDEEVVRFEATMIERPELAADVNVRRRIKTGLQLLEQRSELNPLLTPASPRPQFLRYAAAAVVLVAVASFWGVWRYQGGSTAQVLFASSEIGARNVAAKYLVARTRAAGAPEFKAQRNAGLLQFQILIDDSGGAPFAVRLMVGKKDSGAVPIGDSKTSQITDGFAEIYLDPRELNSGDYVLSVKSQSGAEQLFPITLHVLE